MVTGDERAVKLVPIVVLRSGRRVVGSREVVITVNMPLFLTVIVVNPGESSVADEVSCGKYDTCVVVGADDVGGSDGVGEGAVNGKEAVGSNMADMDGGAIRNGVAVCALPILLSLSLVDEGEGGALVASCSIVARPVPGTVI